MSAPDITTEIIGFRQWHVTPDLKLRAAHKASHEWETGANTATCDRVVQSKRTGDYRTKPCKDTPGNECECGFYALHDPSDFWYGKNSRNLWQSLSLSWGANDDPLVSGVIVAWGKIEVHHDGFRAEHARIVALALPDGKRDAAVVRAAAAAYGVPCVPVDALPKIAAEFGITVPVEMRPEKPEPKVDDLSFTLTGYVSSFLGGNTFLGGSGSSYHYTTPAVTWDPNTLWMPGGYLIPPVSPPAPPPQTRNPISKRQPANRQGPHTGRKRPPKDLGKGRP